MYKFYIIFSNELSLILLFLGIIMIIGYVEHTCALINDYCAGHLGMDLAYE